MKFKSKFAKNFLLFALVFILGSSLSFGANAYLIWRDGGLLAIPADFEYPSVFNTNQRSRTDEARNTWNNLRSYTILGRSSTSNTQTVFPNNNDRHQITIVTTGSGALMQTSTYFVRRPVLIGKQYITDADININNSYIWHTTSSTTIAPNAVDFLSCMLHEFGHAAGIDDSNLETSNGAPVVMWGRIGSGVIRRTLNYYDDVQAFYALY